jgi:nucleoside-diphosphate-sugar epimerase
LAAKVKIMQPEDPAVGEPEAAPDVAHPAAAPVLVTGATGFAGGHLALRLRRLGHPVRALVRPAARTGHLQAAGVDLVEGDLRRPDDVLRAAEGVATIYHIAAVYRTAGHPDSYYRAVNVGGTEHVLAAAAKHRVARTVHCSTVGVHGDVKEIPCAEDSPFNPGDIYQETKLAGELKAQAAFAGGLPGVVFRPAAIYGPGDLRLLKLFKTIADRRFRMFGSGETFYHLVAVDDLVDGILLCGTHPAALGRTYILAGERWVTLNELAQEIAAALDVPPPKGHLPYWPLAAGAALCEAVCKPLGIEPPLHRRRAAFFVKHRAFSIARARQELGYAPKVTVAEGVRRTAAWYCAQGHLGRQAA